MDIPDNIINKNLYKKAKTEADKVYKRPSAYKSMFISKKYKELGGKYKNNSINNSKLDIWRSEKWMSVKDYLEGKIIPCGSPSIGRNACRPTVKINKDTPLTIQELIKKHGKTKLKEIVNKKIKNMDKRINWNKLI